MPCWSGGPLAARRWPAPTHWHPPTHGRLHAAGHARPGTHTQQAWRPCPTNPGLGPATSARLLLFAPGVGLKLHMPRGAVPVPPASQGPRGIGCDPAGHQALRLLATTCLPLGRQHERQLSASAAVPGCSCLRPTGSPPAGCVLQTTYHRGDGLGAQMYIRQSHLLEAAQLGCTYADTPLDARFAGKLAHASVASEVRAFFNLGSATANGACPADAPPQLRGGTAPGGPLRRTGRREWCESRSRDLRADPKAAARLRRAATSGAWCASAYP